MKYTEEQLKEALNYLIDFLLDHFKNQLITDNLDEVYDIITNCNNHTDELPDKKLPIQILGRLTDVFLKEDPELFTKLNKLYPFMFFGSEIEELNIPKNIEKFESNQALTGLRLTPFTGSKIKIINYEGTRDDWLRLIRQSNQDNLENSFYSKKIIVNCSDAENIYNVNTTDNTNLNEDMDPEEVQFKRNALNYLREDGFPTFADYLSHFHFNYCTSKQAGRPFVAAISTQTGTILINPNLDIGGLSVSLRHEACHQIFKHLEHMFAKLKEMGIDTPSQLALELANKTGDYHISNEIYDSADMTRMKDLRIEDYEQFQGLVTELDFKENPEYWTMDFDELWDVFVKDYKKEELDAAAIKASDGYVEGYNAFIDAYNEGKISKEQIRKWYEQNKFKI